MIPNDPYLYHYCSVATFHAIASTKSVRLSAVRHSNDATEGALLSAAVARLATRAGLPNEEAAAMLDRARILETQFEGMALCLSEDGDLLSQWRGYADDGQGVAIGFRRTFLNDLVALAEKTDGDDNHFDLGLHQVRYHEDEHDSIIAPLFKLLQEFQAERHAPDSDESEQVCRLRLRLDALQSLRLSLEAFDNVYLLKHAAFAEEREWRLLHHLDWQDSRHAEFYSKRSRLAPFVNLPFATVQSPAIGVVVLGPRHTTPDYVVSRFLEATGNADVAVTRSSSPYRRDP